MSRDLSDASIAALFAQQTDDVFAVLLTFSSASLNDNIRVSSDPTELLPIAGIKGTISREEEYVFMPFDLKLPQQDSTGISKASLTIDNVHRDIIATLRSIRTKIFLKIEVIRVAAADNPEISIADLQLSNVTHNAFDISGDLSMEYYDQEPFPKQKFTPGAFPGIF